MEHFVVSARKYRPQTFKDVVGQQAITNTLLNAIDNNHLAQALLFCGPRGVGKTTCARILAKEINKDGSETTDEDFSFNIFELDAASNNSVDDIRNLIDQVRIPPQVGKYKVYIIDEVHMLSQAAFNAFLKTLEEPPKHAIFILATTEKHKIIPTILSRCQIFDFKRITVKDAAEYLQYIAESQGVTAESDALHIIAQKADGAMRDALSIFDRVVSFSGKNLTRQAVTENLNVLDYDTYFTVTNYVLEHNIPGLLVYFNEVLAKGFEGHHFITGLASHFRDLMVCQNQDTINLLEVGEKAKQQYLEQSKKTDIPFLLKAIDIANTCDLNYKASKNQRLLVELCLMQLASINFDGEKKNDKPYLIPASHFKTNNVVVKETVAAIEPSAVKEKETTTPPESISQVAEPQEPLQQPEIPKKEEVVTQEAASPKIDIKPSGKKISGLSLSSLKAKKEHQEKQQEVVIDESNLPSDDFTEETMQHEWKTFVASIEKNGKKILASNLSSDAPKLKDATTITLEVANDTMKKEIERGQYGLMEHLKKTLNNYYITLEITVNEVAEQKYAFTPQEKYEKLREQNPNIELLRKEFDLDI
jgi:DNA polymerase-3 subunit gamma/tau